MKLILILFLFSEAVNADAISFQGHWSMTTITCGGVAQAFTGFTRTLNITGSWVNVIDKTATCEAGVHWNNSLIFAPNNFALGYTQPAAGSTQLMPTHLGCKPDGCQISYPWIGGSIYSNNTGSNFVAGSTYT